MVRRLPLLLATTTAIAVLPSVASAANGLRPRTPAIYSGVPCVQSVTRGEPVLIEYDVSYDDTELTPEELPDSRKHQFFAFSQTNVDFAFPKYINQSDFDRAEANGDNTVPYDDDDILDISSLWPAGTHVRITPDDPRLPITQAQAAMGVTWDTSDVSPGTWVVAAYTWEPENNLWSPRFGAVRVEDAGDPDSAGPTVFLSRVDGLLADRAEPLPLDGCIEAPEGSTITASWATVGTGQEPDWVPFVDNQAVESGALDLDFMAPAETGDSIKIRIEIVDPSGRSYVAYSPTTIGVIGEAPPEPTESGCASEPQRPAYGAALFGVLLVLGAGRYRRRR
ncbi:MAG: hypothetical protein AAF799_39895 [Myxococcota bacterium]